MTAVAGQKGQSAIRWWIFKRSARWR